MTAINTEPAHEQARSPEVIAVIGATGRAGRHVVELLAEAGHTPVPISRGTGIDVTRLTELTQALKGVTCVIDAVSASASGVTRLDPAAARTFFVAAAENLHAAGLRAGVERIVEMSVLGVDRFTHGHGAAKYAHERAMLAGPLPVRVLRAPHFHEMLPQILAWGAEADVVRIRRMRIQPIAARSAAWALVDLATDPVWVMSPTRTQANVSEVAGPRAENFLDLARLYLTVTGSPARLEEFDNPADPDDRVWSDGSLLPAPNATLTGPTFAGWCASKYQNHGFVISSDHRDDR